MSELTKDQSIVLQVAAKIASDLTTSCPSTTVDQSVSDWASTLQVVYSVLAEMHGWQQIDAPKVAAPAQTQVEQAVATVQAVFEQTAQVVPEQKFTARTSVRVAGKQHGDLPDWLLSACAEDGVSEVWDNRDGLAQNPKRPHFKAVQGGKGYWPPRGR